MSASVASSAVGLLDRHYSPPSPRLDATRWPDVMEIDRPNEAQTVHDDSKVVVQEVDEVRPEIHGDQTDVDRQDTIGGLLAALANTANTSNASQQTDTTKIGDTSFKPVEHAVRRSMTPPADSPISQTSQNDFTFVKEEGATNEADHAHLPYLMINNNHSSHAPTPSVVSVNSQSEPDHGQTLPFTEEDFASLPFPSLDMAMNDLPPDLQDQIPINVKRQIDAYARLEFADGTFYLNTFQCELGRDQHAYRDALKRDREALEAAEQEKDLQKSSSGKASQRSYVINAVSAIKAESQVQGSVVSEAGGFAGVDDQPADGHGEKRLGQDGKYHSSQASESSVVRPSEVLHNPSLLPYDYHKDVTYQPSQLAPVPENDLVEDEQPAPVTSEHLPNPNSCPLIPIHTTIASDQTEIESLKAISRRHIRIFWHSKQSAFYMEVLGRNGAFFEDEHMKRSESVRLYSGARIQISAVEFTFRLPDVIADAPTEDEESIDESDDDLDSSPTAASAMAVENGKPIKLKLKLNTDSAASHAAALNGELKRRGPGRPPKNGVMSQREMKEREKAEKEAKARNVHGVASPPALQRKLSKSQPPRPEPSPIVADGEQSEKRKHTKRKRDDGEEEEVLQSIEAQEDVPVIEPIPQPLPLPVAKRARTKSFSPEYKPVDQCTAEDLARPPHNYAVLLYMVLSDTGEITLRQIYKQMQSRWPFFKYVVDSDGWTSSVRHNLNQEVGKLFERGRKEGKGFTWLPKPNAMEEYQAQKNKRSNAPPVPRPRAPPQRPNYPPNHGQQLTWQNNASAPQANRPGDPYPPQGPWSAQQPNGSKSTQLPNGASSINGQRPLPGQPPNLPINRDPNYIPPTHLLPQHFGRPAPRFMPVTFEGLAVIARFEQSMFQNLRQDEETQAKWRQIFASAKGRCLHGNEKSTLEGGETAEETTIVKHISNFVTRYQNPAFEGFKTTRTESPALSSINPPTTMPPPATSVPTESRPSSQIAQREPPDQANLSHQAGKSLENPLNTSSSVPLQNVARDAQIKESAQPGLLAQPASAVQPTQTMSSLSVVPAINTPTQTLQPEAITPIANPVPSADSHSHPSVQVSLSGSIPAEMQPQESNVNAQSAMMPLASSIPSTNQNSALSGVTITGPTTIPVTKIQHEKSETHEKQIVSSLPCSEQTNVVQKSSPIVISSRTVEPHSATPHVTETNVSKVQSPIDLQVAVANDVQPVSHDVPKCLPANN